MTTQEQRDKLRKHATYSDEPPMPVDCRTLLSLLDEADELERIKSQWPYAHDEGVLPGEYYEPPQVADGATWPTDVMQTIIKSTVRFHPIEKPTEDGYYWWRRCDGEVFMVKCDNGFCCEMADGPYFVPSSAGQLLGPRIPQPPAPENTV